MPRKQLIRSSENPYHVTCRSNNKEWFYIPIEDVWRYCSDLLVKGEEKFAVKIDGFVLMNNHYHLLLYTPEANIDQFMHYLNLNLSKAISRQAERINRIFGASYKWSLIKDQAYYYNVVRYIYQNPLRAGLVERCEDYKFCDLKRKKRDSEFLRWINQKLSDEECGKTKRNLRKAVIEPK